MTQRFRSLLAACFVSCVGLGCAGNAQLTNGNEGALDPLGTGAGGDTDVPSVQPTPASPNFPFIAVSPRSYVNKVKTLLTGVGADPNEIAQGADDAGLAALVDGYMADPRFQDVLFDFFGLAFQQSAVTDLSFLYMTHNGFMVGQDADEFRSSFARTALYTVNNNLPFNQLMYTQRFMVTTKMLWHMAVMEGFNDGGGVAPDYMLFQNPNFTLYLDPQRGASSLQDLLNPSSANYLRFYRPDLAKLTDRGPDCGMGSTNPISLTSANSYVPLYAGAMMHLIHDGDYTYYKGSGGCYVSASGAPTSTTRRG